VTVTVTSALGFLFALVPTGNELGLLWEVTKGTCLALGAAGALGVFRMRDDVRDIKTELRGMEGKGGLTAKVDDHEVRVGKLEDRFVAIDAVQEAEQASYHGPERRRHPAIRKLLEIIHEEEQRGR